MKWISVKERLPNKIGHYLVYWDNSPSKDYPLICSKYDVLFWGVSWWAPVSEEQPVTHWMPLPKPPESNELPD